MCLILFAWRQHPDYPLILIANRDEYYARPTRDAHWWEETPVFAGRDLEAGGTWLGVNSRGRLAAVTNVREPGAMKPGKKSRGALTQNFLSGDATPKAFLQELAPDDRNYAGFNLLLGDAQGLWFYSNRDHGIRSVDPGVYGISNGTFDEPWPKLSSGKQELKAMLDGKIIAANLMEILTDHQVAQDHELPQTGVSLDIERMLSSRFIRSPEYGTRACSVVTIGADKQISFNEQNYLDAEHSGNLVQETFEIAM
ncbi:MAG: NRDE family protein [Gammaproteobacteria bacterium]|nr:NRDE family protein [Gammaproteobacteria bacterium]